MASILRRPRGAPHAHAGACSTDACGSAELKSLSGTVSVGGWETSVKFVQKVSLAASQSHRSPPLPGSCPAKFNVELITPNVVLPGVQTVPGLAKCGVFVTLNASARNCNFTRSVILKSRKRLVSKLNRPGPRRMLRPLVPNRTRPVGTPVNALGSK